MTAPKFTFDTEFRAEGDVVSNAARARQKKAFAQEEIDAMCARARNEGIKAGQVRAQEAIAAAAADLASQVRSLIARSETDIQAVRAEAIHLAVALAKKLAQAAIASAPETEVEAALRETLHQAIGEPRIVLKAAPAVADALAPRIAEIAGEEGFDGKVILSADPHIKAGDCRMEWRGAGAEYSQAAVEQALDALIARHFSQHSAEG